MRIDVVTLFPELFAPFLATSIVGRAVSSGALEVGFKSPREHGIGRHRSIDDTPYGGGSGMVMRVDCLVETLESIDVEARDRDVGDLGAGARAHRVLLTPEGAVLDQRRVEALVTRPAIVLVCGRYEGFDDRLHAYVDEEVSLGDFVLSGGEVAAMAVIDACGRLLPGAVGNSASLSRESHSLALGGLLEYPQFTRPAEFRGAAVPAVLQSGNHRDIEAWRVSEAERRTEARRPDLFAAYRARRRASGEGGGAR